MEIRITKPEKGNKFYTRKASGGYSTCIKGKPTDACDVLSNCVGYACGRFNEIIGEMKYPSLNCNAENFIERAKSLGLEISDVPTLGGIMVWQKGDTLGSNDGAGHVAVIERIDSTNQIYTSESNYGGEAFFNATRTNNNGRWGLSNKYKFRGCIINPAIGKVVAEEEIGYKTGVYKVLENLYIRKTAGTNEHVLVKDCTDAMKNALTSTNGNDYAVVKAGHNITALEIIEKDNGSVWVKNYSGYLCLKGVSGQVYLEFVE